MSSTRTLGIAACAASLLAIAWHASAQQPLPSLPSASSAAPQPAPVPPAGSAVPQPLPPAPAPPAGAAPGYPPAQPYAPAQPYPPGYGQPYQPYPGQQPPPVYSQPYPGQQPGYGPPAYGQPAYGPPPSYPAPVTTLPPPERAGRLHEGFYLRLSGGLMNMNVTITPDTLPIRPKLSGLGIALDLAVGAALFPGFIIGGRIAAMQPYDPKYEDNVGSSSRNDIELSMQTMQFFMDIYPMPSKGLHFMGAVGPTSLSFSQRSQYSDSQTIDSSASGIGMMVGGGWQAWIARKWSLGGAIALNWAWMEDRVEFRSQTGNITSVSQYDTAKVRAFVPSLLFTATFN